MPQLRHSDVANRRLKRLSADGSGFLFEPSLTLRIPSGAPTKHFERDLALKPGVQRAIHIAHFADADPAEDRVVRKKPAFREFAVAVHAILVSDFRPSLSYLNSWRKLYCRTGGHTVEKMPAVRQKRRKSSKAISGACCGITRRIHIERCGFPEHPVETGVVRTDRRLTPLSLAVAVRMGPC
jgi:hypothetical protein